MEFTREVEVINYVKELKYIVIYPDMSCKLYKSLRSIQTDICIDSSTISKKLALGENICKAKGTEYIFYIQKIKL